MHSICQICGSSSWLDLPNPGPRRSVTTAGRILDEPLGKSQCAECGLVQRIAARFLGHTDYYEQDYAKYYDRPGTTQYHRARYDVLVKWMASASPLMPTRILDVGCGQGWAMEAMRALYPEAIIEGIEPSNFNSEVARNKGFVVYEARAGLAELPRTKYDLVYANNVIQHVTNARQFVESLKDMVSDEGVIIITCPDGSVPNIEILWSDQNFSFLPEHLIRLCKEIGFSTIEWFDSPSSPSVPPAQMLLLSKDCELLKGRNGREVPAASLLDIYRSKSDYLNSFTVIDDYICSRTRGCRRVFNFGASYWSSILAAYCPRYWQEVSACLVEEIAAGSPFLDKRVMQMEVAKPTDKDAVVLGTSPATHESLSARYATAGQTVISWNQFIRY